MPPTPDEGDWPHPLTVFTSISALHDTLAARLMERYLEQLRAGLTVEEREYADLYKPPRIDVGIEPDGEKLLRISFGGTVTTVGWDGTEEGAMSLVADCGMNTAFNASSDYWITGGWRSRTTFTGQDSDHEP